MKTFDLTCAAVASFPDSVIHDPSLNTFTLLDGTVLKAWIVFERNELDDLNYAQLEEIGVELDSMSADACEAD